MAHLDMGVLAEFRAGLITGRRGARIAAHLADCDRCAGLDDKLAGVSALLASVLVPPMPDRVAQRLDSVLAAERAKAHYRARAHGASARESEARLLALRVLAPVAVVLLAATGYGVSRIVSGPASKPTYSTAGSAAKAANRAAAPIAEPCSSESPRPTRTPTPSAALHPANQPRTQPATPRTRPAYNSPPPRTPTLPDQGSARHNSRTTNMPSGRCTLPAGPLP
jgi:hypothetical protein